MIFSIYCSGKRPWSSIKSFQQKLSLVYGGRYSFIWIKHIVVHIIIPGCHDLFVDSIFFQCFHPCQIILVNVAQFHLEYRLDFLKVFFRFTYLTLHEKRLQDIIVLCPDLRRCVFDQCSPGIDFFFRTVFSAWCCFRLSLSSCSLVSSSWDVCVYML